MQLTEKTQQKEINKTVIIEKSNSNKRDNSCKNVGFMLNPQEKLDVYLCNEDFMFLNSNDKTYKEFKPYQKNYIYALGLFYEYAMNKYNFNNDNRWLMLFNIIEAMITTTKEKSKDIRMDIVVGKFGKKYFQKYLSTEWNNAWVFISNWKDETQLLFEEIINGHRTNHSFSFNITQIKDISIQFRSWVDEITVSIKYVNVDYQISFYGLNSIIEPLIVKESEDNDEQLN